MTTVTQSLPTSTMNSYADIVNQKQPQVSNCTEDVPIELNDNRMKNRLFLLHPDLIERLEYTYNTPPPPRRFKLQCLQDFIDKVSNKDEDDDDDDDYDNYNDIYNEDRLHESPCLNNDDDTFYDSDYDYEKELDIEY